jgi:hypothetical protein
MIRSYFSMLALLFAALTLLAGCQGSKEQDALKATLSGYEKVLRWQGPDKQAQFLKEPASMPDYSGIRVLGYEVISRPAPLSDGLVGQVARIQYIHADTQMIRTIDDRQLWERDPGDKHWLRVNPPPPMRR